MIVYSSSAIATLVNCVLEGNSALSGGGLYVRAGTAMLYGCTFDDNTADGSGPDIENYGGSVYVYGDGPGYPTSDCTEGDALAVVGTISGTPNSFSGCTTV